MSRRTVWGEKIPVVSGRLALSFFANLNQIILRKIEVLEHDSRRFVCFQFQENNHRFCHLYNDEKTRFLDF